MADAEQAPSPLTPTDQVLLRALRAWLGEPPEGFWDRFRPEWRATLRFGWAETSKIPPDSARESLRCEHEAQARPDLASVHVSWWVRALADEPDSVRKTVIANLPPAIADALRSGLEYGECDLAADRPPHPAALSAALSLWHARLIGDLDARGNDAPVVRAITQLDAPTLARLIQATGLAKWSVTPQPPPIEEEDDARRLAVLKQELSTLDPRYLPVAMRDVESIRPSESRRLMRAGLIVFARLLSTVDPYRARWALQHIPYNTARAIRPLMKPLSGRAPLVARWESIVFRAAWTVLHHEGRIHEPWRPAT